MEQTNNPSAPDKHIPFWKKKKVLIVASFLLILLVILAFIIVGRKPELLPEVNVAEPTGPVSLTENDGVTGGNASVGIGVVTKVKRERIYESDVQHELSQYPQLPGQDSRAIVIRKISADSTLLQEAADRGLITLDPAVFDSSNKDYDKRIQLVEQAKAALDSLGSEIEGTVLSIWFDNGGVGPLGLVQSKQLAFTKISAIQQGLKNKTMTVSQAISAIKNDTSLAQLDPVYADNAAFTFQVKGTDAITLDPEFDAILRETPEGGVTDVFLGGAKEEGQTQKQDALYMFGVVTRRSTP